MTGYFGPVGSNTASILMRQAPFIIGDLVLEGHEVPARISIGGAQVVAIHKMPGGTRIIDAMGADSSAIAWRGIFIGPGAAQRARALDLMRQQGMPRILSFGDYTLDIVIVNYSYDYQDQGAVISYRIRGEIVPARSKTVGSASTIGSLVQDDLLTAQDVLQIGATAASAYASLAVSGNETSASALAMTSLATSLAATSAAAASASLDTASGSAPVQSNLEAIAVALSAAVGSVSVGIPSSSTTGISFASSSELAVLTGQAAALASLTRSAGYVNRTNLNLASANAQTLAPLVQI